MAVPMGRDSTTEAAPKPPASTYIAASISVIDGVAIAGHSTTISPRSLPAR